jgi:hypothetical protein
MPGRHDLIGKIVFIGVAALPVARFKDVAGAAEIADE